MCDTRVAYVMSQVVCAQIEMEAMKAANRECQNKGEPDAFDQKAFMELLQKYPIGHNAVISFLNNLSI